MHREQLEDGGANRDEIQGILQVPAWRTAGGTPRPKRLGDSIPIGAYAQSAILFFVPIGDTASLSWLPSLTINAWRVGRALGKKW